MIVMEIMFPLKCLYHIKPQVSFGINELIPHSETILEFVWFDILSLN